MRKLPFAHYECQCGYIYTKEEVQYAKVDYLCPDCYTPMSEAMYVSPYKTKESEKNETI
jgi:hypothetical protein